MQERGEQGMALDRSIPHDPAGDLDGPMPSVDENAEVAA